MSWNQYPHPFADDVTALVAGYAQVPADGVLTGPGTNHLITLLMSTLTRAMKGKLVIARPSFPLYESHARGEGIAYETWDLDENLEYSLNKLPHMPTGSILIFASPNNPVGNVLEKKDLATLCAQHPQSLIIADEAYFEFADESYTSLLEEHSNLLLLRTCSKTLGAAGLRLGYMLGAAPLIAELKKMRLPYLLNIFTIAAHDNVYAKPAFAASFSNYGNPDPIDFIAPGMSIYSTFLVSKGSYAYMSGTSMAAPHVTGLLLVGEKVDTNGTITYQLATYPRAYKHNTSP
jgi:histidinol-phosphate/aromatic aminotransferase/cobyric acid decarboxylase-like protein